MFPGNQKRPSYFSSRYIVIHQRYPHDKISRPKCWTLNVHINEYICVQYAVITFIQNMIHELPASASPESLLEMPNLIPKPKCSQSESAFRWDTLSQFA